jgi:hypothetical protein
MSDTDSVASPSLHELNAALSVADTRSPEDNVSELPLPENLVPTENGALAYENVKGELGLVLKYFFDPCEEVLWSSWEENSLLTLQVVFNYGNIRNGQGGKASREHFYTGLEHLYQEHFETLMANLAKIPVHTSFPVVLDLLEWAMKEPGERKGGPFTKWKLNHTKKMKKFGAWKDTKKEYVETLEGVTKLSDVYTENKDRRGGTWSSKTIQEGYERFCKERYSQKKTLEARKEKRKVAREEVMTRDWGEETGKVTRLFQEVLNMFASPLQEFLNSGEKTLENQLVAKWAPSRDSRFAKSTGLDRALREHLFPGEDEGLQVVKYQQLLSKLRASLPEHYVGKQLWGLVNFETMTGGCRKKWGRLFGKKDPDRYNAYLQQVEAGKARMNVGGGLLPHQLIARVNDTEKGSFERKETVLMFREYVNGFLSRAGDDEGLIIPVCDVSGSMSGDPMEVAIAMSLLLSLRKGPFHGKMFTFSEKPKLVDVLHGEEYDPATFDLAKVVNDIQEMEWGGSTNFYLIMKDLLDLALKNNFTDEQVENVKICVFSDMEFNQAAGYIWAAPPWETTHESIGRMWGDAGYRKCPTIVYWNIREGPSGHVPVENADEKGVVLLNGYSPSLLEAFLNNNLEEFNPAAQMLRVLHMECYKDLVVVD